MPHTRSEKPVALVNPCEPSARKRGGSAGQGRTARNAGGVSGSDEATSASVPSQRRESRAHEPPEEAETRRRLRPLQVRVGARHACFGDGLCCTDLHGLGPLTRREVEALCLVSEEVVVPGEETGFDEPMIRTRADGGWVLLGEGRCDLHAALGAGFKPSGCRRFPLGLTATPTGGRITTRHRCPCRTLGERPALRAEDAAPSLLSRKGRLSADRRVGRRIALTRKNRITFQEYEVCEARLLGRLEAGEDPPTVLDCAPFPRLKGTTWKHVAREMLEDGADDTRFGCALEWFAGSVLALTGSKRPKTRPLAWDESFDRAEARAVEPGSAERVLADWAEDEIWALEWAEGDGTFRRARADLATRLAVAQDIRRRLEKRGRRADRAAAEAVAVVDLLGDSEWWDDVFEALPR